MLWRRTNMVSWNNPQVKSLHCLQWKGKLLYLANDRGPLLPDRSVQRNLGFKFQLRYHLLKCLLYLRDKLFTLFSVLFILFHIINWLNTDTVVLMQWSPKNFSLVFQSRIQGNTQRMQGKNEQIGREPISVWELMKNIQEYMMSNYILKTKQKLSCEEYKGQ